MDDLGEKLNAVLNDPMQFERIASMARSIMGGESGGESSSRREEESPGIDPSVLGKLTELMKKSGGKSDKQALLEAMKPYLSEKRRKKVDKALKLAKLAGFAELAVGAFGEDGDV
ncbi:MAG: hypothetical protein RRY09_06375 [Oscillospiraceae bacterium]